MDITTYQTKDYVRKDLFEKYLSGKKWLILDNTSVGKSSLRLMLKEYGVTMDKIIMANDLEDAEFKMKQERPHFVFTPVEIDKRPGLKLLEIHKDLFPNRLQTFFCMMSDDSSLAGSTRLADKGVDLLIIRPYSSELLNKQFLSSLATKITPSPYTEFLEHGKELMLLKNIEKALLEFKNAVRADNTQASAYYYIGLIYFENEDYDLAENNFKKGLELNETHYRCMNGLFDLYYKIKKYDLAYEMFVRLGKEYPVNSKRLPDYIRLCVMIRKYDDIIGFCNLFSGVISESEDDDLSTRQVRKHLVAGLVVAGEYLISMGEGQKAIKAFKTAAYNCNGSYNVLQKIMIELIKGDRQQVAEEILVRLLSDSVISIRDKKLLEFDMAMVIYPPDRRLEVGLRMISDGIKDFHIYDEVIKNSLNINRNQDIVKEIIFDAIELFPEKTEYLRNLIP